MEIEVRNVDRILITKVYIRLQGCSPEWPSGGHKSAPVRHKDMLSPLAFSSSIINEDLLGGAAADVYFQ
jgi:hypothetical protein